MAEAEERAAAASVLDASALIALLHDEPGAEAAVEAIAAGAAVSVVNWAEVLSRRECSRRPGLGSRSDFQRFTAWAISDNRRSARGPCRPS